MSRNPRRRLTEAGHGRAATQATRAVPDVIQPVSTQEFSMSLNKPLITYIAIAATAMLSAGSVFAQDATPDQARAQAVASTTTRAAVQAETTAFTASGQPSPWSSKYSNRSQTVAVSQPREAVKAETLRALKANEVTDAGEVFSITPARPAQVATAAR